MLVLFLCSPFIKIKDGPYYFGLIGLMVILFPLIGLGSLHVEIRAEKIAVKPYYLSAAFFSIVVVILNVMLGMFIVIAITCMVLTCLWSIVLSLEETIRDRLNKYSITFARGVYLFLIIFMYFNGIDIPVRAIAAGIIELWEATFDILEGISIIGVMVFLLVVCRYRFGGLVSPLIMVYVYFFPAQQLIDHFADTSGEFLPAFAVMASILIVLAVNAGFGLARCISDTNVLVKNGRSGFFGPWFAAIIKNPRYPRASTGIEKPFTPAQKRTVMKGIVVCLAMTAVILPGFLPYMNVFRIPIQITPITDYTMRFNFWASPYLRDYPVAWRDQLKAYHANVDMVLGQVTPEYVKYNLTEFDENMTGVTYRIVISPPSIAQLQDYVETATNILLPYANNGSLQGWRGFGFDIESVPFSDLSCNGSITQEIAIWNRVFDYVGNRTINGKPIEMESISYPLDPADIAFDGDIDIQTFTRQVSAFPDRFTSYAPMIYRCIMTGNPPNGSPMDPLRPWYTSYSVYSHLKTLASCVPVEKMGVYLGILNCSCYGTGLPQPEPISWGNATGFGNLLRDVLICKNFGMKEVTFFMLNTYQDASGWVNGGAFDTYGIDFLKMLNDTVNTNPPASFYIYYNKKDASINQTLMLDWILDFSRLPGLLEVFAMACAVVLAMLVPSLLRRLKK